MKDQANLLPGTKSAMTTGCLWFNSAMAPEETGKSKLLWWFMGIVAAVIAGVVSAVIIAKLNVGGTGGMPVDYSGSYYGQVQGGPSGGTVQLQVNEAGAAGGSTKAEITWGGSLNGSGTLQGAFNANSITFDGQFNSEQGLWDIKMPCVFTDSGSVTCQYQIQAAASSGSAPKNGSFSAIKS